MMHLPPQTIAFTAWMEGFHAAPYRDGNGWTCGYGHWTPYKPYGLISRAKAKQWLRIDLQHVQAVILRTTGSFRPSAGQLEALDDFVYNVGVGAWMGSTLRRDLCAGQIRRAAGQFGRWVYCGGRVLPGLVRRRKMEEWLFVESS